jgi:hypothetical protein
VEDTEHMVTETLIRGMYRYWRQVMEAAPSGEAPGQSPANGPPASA